MREITLHELHRLALLSRRALWGAAELAGHDTPKIYLHWTAGGYWHFFDDYHINIDEDGGLHASTEDLAEVLAHTWRRNTGGVGVALCGCYDATTTDLGSAPPTLAQIEAMAQAVAVLCEELGLPIEKACVLTHGEAADVEDGDTAGYGYNDAYGPKNGCEKWDLEYLGTPESPAYHPYATDGSRGGDVLRGKAIYWQNKWRADAERALPE